MAEDAPRISPEELEQATGVEVNVLVIDSGVEVSHPDFENSAIESWQVTSVGRGRSEVVKGDGTDVFGHGTAVAWIIERYAPDATIHSLQIFGGNLRASSERALAGLSWAIGRGYDVVNCSFGSGDARFLPAYKKLVDRAFCSECLLVAASSNLDFRQTEFPGSFPSVLSTDFGNLSGLRVQRRAGHLVEFVACGHEVHVAWKDGGHREVTGSSFAAPHITALAARIKQLRPTWNAIQVKAALYDYARSCEVDA